MTTRSATLAYAGRGLPVFPVAARGKRPLVEHGLHDATTDSDVIAAWWRRWPDANVGLCTGPASGVLVLDVDGEPGERTLVDLQAAAGASLPPTATVSTPRGGRHLYFRHPVAIIANSAGKLGPGLDVRGAGGYVVAPPSVGANGRPYAWSCRAALAPVPAWLLERLLPRPVAVPAQPLTVTSGNNYGAAALRAEADAVATTPTGQRNHRLFLAAARLGELVGAGMLTEGETGAVLRAAAFAAGLHEHETEQTIASGLGRGRLHPRAVAS